MSVAKNLERRLERLIEGVAGRVFSGKLHPSELAGKLAREADFARFDHPSGPATANVFVIEVNPKDLNIDTTKLEDMLAAEMTAYAAEEGLRLEGPVSVHIEASDAAPAGATNCHVEVVPGPPVIWSRLSADGETYDIGRNRAIVGRSDGADVVIRHDDISREHALLYREHGQTWIVDLASANGTAVDTQKIGREPQQVHPGSIVELAGHRYRLIGV